VEKRNVIEPGRTPAASDAAAAGVKTAGELEDHVMERAAAAGKAVCRQARRIRTDGGCQQAKDGSASQ